MSSILYCSETFWACCGTRLVLEAKFRPLGDAAVGLLLNGKDVDASDSGSEPEESVEDVDSNDSESENSSSDESEGTPYVVLFIGGGRFLCLIMILILT